MRLLQRLAAPVFTSALAIVGGCTADLPPCDPVAATEVVYLDALSDVTNDDGLPMYAGQALFHQSCGGGAYCHSSRAEGALRAAAPRGLDWDLGVPCVDAPCAPGSSAASRFASHLASIRADRHNLYGSVESGDMPPGAVGRTVLSRSGVPRRVSAGGTLAEGEPLPTIHTSEGRRIFANWLACGAPSVQTALPPDASHAPGAPCEGAASDVGDCVTRMLVPVEPPEPTWDSLYERLFAPLCGDACHGGPSPHVGKIDFSDVNRAYEAILAHRLGVGPLVVPGDPSASPLIAMLGAGGAGIPQMPPTQLSGRMPDVLREAVRLWIADGAPR